MNGAAPCKWVGVQGGVCDHLLTNTQYIMHAHMHTGVCLVHPELLDFTEFEELTDLCLPSWILSGCSLYTDGLSSTDDYPLDLDALPQGAKVGVRVSHDGELHFFVNGADMGVAASGLPAEGSHDVVVLLVTSDLCCRSVWVCGGLWDVCQDLHRGSGIHGNQESHDIRDSIKRVGKSHCWLLKLSRRAGCQSC